MTGLGSLKRIATPREKAPEPDEHCEFCNMDIGERHGHVADVSDHRLMCVCRPCYLLFGPDGAGGGRFRGVGEDVRRVEGLSLDPVTWESLRIPVDLAFFFRQGDQLLAFYPGPGGATESLLDLSAWADIVAANSVLDDLEPDVQAVLLRRRDDAFTCHLVPIDVCYELVGQVRLSWTGLGGGPEVWREIDAFFAGLDRRSTPVSARDDG